MLHNVPADQILAVTEQTGETTLPVKVSLR
jgi:hypothetical protein